jgi:hypothetical protein
MTAMRESYKNVILKNYLKCNSHQIDESAQPGLVPGKRFAAGGPMV